MSKCLCEPFLPRRTHEKGRFSSLFRTDRVIGSDKFACGLSEIDQKLQERVALPQHHCGPYGALRSLQPCGQALDALLQFGHCGEPTLLFETAGGALEREKSRWGGKRDQLQLLCPTVKDNKTHILESYISMAAMSVHHTEELLCNSVKISLSRSTFSRLQQQQENIWMVILIWWHNDVRDFLLLSKRRTFTNQHLQIEGVSGSHLSVLPQVRRLFQVDPGRFECFVHHLDASVPQRDVLPASLAHPPHRQTSPLGLPTSSPVGDGHVDKEAAVGQQVSG